MIVILCRARTQKQTMDRGERPSGSPFHGLQSEREEAVEVGQKDGRVVGKESRESVSTHAMITRQAVITEASEHPIILSMSP